MVYLDYSANTPPRKEILNTFVSISENYLANPNSSHSEGVKAKEIIDNTSNLISKYFNCSAQDVIYTSGSSESNNTVIKGLAELNKGKKILISEIEHSSIISPCNYLISKGYDVDFIHITQDGTINLNELKQKIDENTFLVSICAVDSELGTIQPIQEIKEIVKGFPNCYFHTDATQAIGKVKINYDNIDFITFAPHKFFGLNGSGVLINRNRTKIIPLIHGGKSTTIFRSGTPVAANIATLGEALIFAQNDLESDKVWNYISELKIFLKEELNKNIGDKININSPEKNSIPHVLNFSLKYGKSKDVVKKLSDKNIFVSTGSACSLDGVPSRSVYAITKNKDFSLNSIRVSLSYKTTVDELKIFIKELFNIINTLKI